MTDVWLRFNHRSTITLAREALMARVVKLALDGKQDLKREAEGALADINAALVESLPDRPSVANDPMVNCFIRKSELKDLETALNGYIIDRDGEECPDRARFDELLRRTRISIALAR